MANKKTPKVRIRFLAACSSLSRAIFQILSDSETPLRQKEVADLVKSKSVNHVGNYLRRLATYGVLQKRKFLGKGTQYQFFDELKEFVKDELRFYREENKEVA